MSCLQSSESSVQKMSLEIRQFITQDNRIFSWNLRYEDNKSIKNVQEGANLSKLITLQTLSSLCSSSLFLDILKYLGEKTKQNKTNSPPQKQTKPKNKQTNPQTQHFLKAFFSNFIIRNWARRMERHCRDVLI